MNHAADSLEHNVETYIKKWHMQVQTIFKVERKEREREKKRERDRDNYGERERGIIVERDIARDAIGETKPVDTNVNSEIWLYFAMKEKSKKYTFSVVYSNLKRWTHSSPLLPPLSDLRVKKHTLRSKVKQQSYSNN